MDTCASRLARRVQSGQVRTAIEISLDATHRAMRCRSDRCGLRFEVDSVPQACFVNPGKAGMNKATLAMGKVEPYMRGVRALHFCRHGSRHDVARRQVS